MYKICLTSLLLFFTSTICYSQNIDMENYDIYFGDTLIAKQDFMDHSQDFTAEQLKKIQFRPITDGFKKMYCLNGKLCASGKIENKKENGIWEFWYSNGQKTRKGEFINGKPNGTHEYWYQDGTLRAIGNWKNGVYEGKWEVHDKDGKNTIIQNYKDGKEVIE